MKKSLIALAVAGVFAAPAAFAATANVDFYGKFRVSLDHMNNGAGWGMHDRVSRIGFKGAEDLGGGLKAIYQWESGFNIGAAGTSNTGSSVYKNWTSGGTGGGLGGQRNTFIGLAGDFGTVLAGRHDTPYKMVGSADLFADTAADAQNTGSFCVICEDLRVNNAIAYVSPKFSGFQFVGATVVGNHTDSTATTKSTKGLADAYSLAGTYGWGGLKVGVGYENLKNLVGNAAGDASQKATKLNVGYTIDSFKLGATGEWLKDVGGISGEKATNYLLSAAYGMGPITLAVQYGKRNFNDAANADNLQDLTDTTVGAVYSLSKRTSTYVAYAHYKANHATGAEADPDMKYNVVTIGLNHNF